MRLSVRNLVLVTFVGFLALPLAATIAGLSPAQVGENRDREPAPDLAVGRILDDESYDQATRFFVDRFAFRSLAVRTRAKINEVIWKSDTDRVVRGREGWLFLTDSLRRLCTEELDSVESAREFVAFGDALHDRSLPFVLTVAPGKPAAYPELLSERSKRDSRCLTAARARYRDHFAQADRPWFVDIYDEVAAAKATAPEPLYHDRDTHWTERGSLVMVEALLEATHPGIWDPDHIVDAGTQPFEMDLTRLLGLAQVGQVPDIEIVRPGVEVTRLEDIEVEASLPIRRFRATSTDAPLVPGKTLVLHDSFTEMIIHESAAYFEEVSYLHWNAIRVLDLVEQLEGVDTVLVEVVERELAVRAGENLVAQSLAERISEG